MTTLIDKLVIKALNARETLRNDRYTPKPDKNLGKYRLALKQAYDLLAQHQNTDWNDVSDDNLLRYHIELPWAYSSAVNDPNVPGDCAQMGADHYTELCRELYKWYTQTNNGLSDAAFGSQVSDITSKRADWHLITQDRNVRPNVVQSPCAMMAALAWSCSNAMVKGDSTSVEQIWMDRCGKFVKTDIS